jgi:nicotinamidase-related amidase
MDALGTRHKNLLDAHSCLLVVIDVQERFRPHIDQFEEMAANVATLVKASETLLLPVVVTEQYTKGLGPTVAEIKNLERADRPWRFFEKNCFSAAAAVGFTEHLTRLGRKQIVVCGIEAHVCVNQTVHELLHLGYQTHVVVDAVASRTAANKKTALQKMFAAGALPATVEMVLFEMLVEAGTANFKQVQSLVK